MDLLPQISAVFLVLGLLCGGLWLLRRKGWAGINPSFRAQRASKGRLQRLEGLALTPHHSVHLVRVSDRVLLIGVSPNGCRLLHRCSEGSGLSLEDFRQ